MASPTPQPSRPSTDERAQSKSSKNMTKAERRELQERQRAAKAAAAAAASTSTAPARPPPPPQASPGPSRRAPGSSSQPARGRDRDRDTVASVEDAHETAAGKSRGIRIFSHFGIPKPVSHVIKGDVHPAIVRLALQFSSFRICGANARCIATLTAFKTVRSSCLSFFLLLFSY